MLAVNHHPNKLYDVPASAFREVKESTTVVAFFLGMAIIVACIILGRSQMFYITALVFACCITLLWKKAPRPWILLASIAAATPIPLFRQQIACNLIFAACFIILNMKYLTRLPKWIYLLTGMIIFGLITSSVNWLSGNVIGSVLKQSAFFFNFALAPLILVPMIYLRMSESRDHEANLQGLLFFLIIPSTLILLAAKLFGTQANVWQASLHELAGSEGYVQYQLGKVVIDFSRTAIGFILAVLICASTAVTISPVKLRDRLIAGTCLVSNIFLLLATGSFGSMLAILCGLVVIFYDQLRKVRITKVIISVVILCCMVLLIYGLSPSSTKEYLGKRYEHRVANADTDRLTLWTRAVIYIIENPTGVGLRYTVGDKVKSNPHNEYLVYIVSYGVIGGVAYLLLVAGLLISFFRIRKRIIDHPCARALYLAGIGVLVALAVNSMTDNAGVGRWYFNIMWSVTWYCYFCSRAGQSGIVRDEITQNTAVAGTTVAQLR